MADPSPPPAPGAVAAPGSTTSTGTSSSSSGATAYKAPTSNRALRMMGLPNLPKKLPSRNWMIFWTLTAAFSGAIVYDKREKKRATARWARAVSHLAREPIASPSQLPRKLTIYLESPPGDGLRAAQDHYTEYVKPVLAASGLDWEFVQGRQQGDVRAAVAERIRRARAPPADGGAAAAAEELTKEEIVRRVRGTNKTPEYEGVQGDIVIGRHTWKEYVRGIHEGWLGPLTAPVVAEPVDISGAADESKAGEATEKKEEEEKKPERPPQIPPYNTTDDYPTSSLPMIMPAEFSPSTTIGFPHILGFSNTFTRLGRFLNRRKLADDIGREVAAVCFAAAREYKEDDAEPEQQMALVHEERDWPKSVWQEEKPDDKDAEAKPSALTKEAIWTKPVVLDPRISMRMRRFELSADEQARAQEIVVPEEEVEGWIKGSLRGVWRWATTKPEPKSTWVDE
ncbi:mitochondrial import inner membrane translocase subunit Tim54 [Xylariaceae sp. FL0016]|nr:mitochondrial import inner membrane translocase subunit Tim54 [Xylariaceae sp. FL0016]